MARLAIDIGGTFTDGVLILDDGTVVIDKILSTPDDPATAFTTLTDDLAVSSGIEPRDFRQVMHGSTVATNALLEKKGAKVGLLTTRGFRDMLEIGRQVRSELYNLFTTKPTPLVPRWNVCEATERIDYKGAVVAPLDEADVVAAAEHFKENDITSVAICFLHSYANAEHETRAAEILSELMDGVEVSVSSTIAPEIKEYWRASTTTVNAFVSPVVKRYVGRIGDMLADREFEGSLSIMHSGGGVASVDSIQERPFQMIESGPAAGVAAAAYFSRSLGFPNALSFDMGGTTAKAGLILDGRTGVLSEFEVAAAGVSGASSLKAAGYPILGEVVDLVEVGSGGGSIAWIDDGGHLRVGPQGAGADPGPACYGRGGTRPTITDANLVLGYLSAEQGLGGRISLDRTAAEAAIEEHCAAPLGITTHQAAQGIRTIANATMVQALRLVSIERGHDARDFALIGFGGAGPLHACDLATEIGAPTVLIPPNPGVASAWGLLLSDAKHDVRTTHLAALSADSVPALTRALEEVETRMRGRLSTEHLEVSSFELHRYIEARYAGQAHRLRIDIPKDLLSSPDRLADALTDRLHAEHEREFGFRVLNEPVQVATVGITAVAPSEPVPTWSSSVPEPGDDRGVPQQVLLDLAQGFETVPSYQRSALSRDDRIVGPAIIHEFDSTTAVTKGFTARVVDSGVLRIDRE